MRDELDIARTAASAAAQILREHAADIGPVRAKGFAVDLVTQADIRAGVAAAQVLSSRSPGVPVVVEEPEVYDLAGITPGSLSDHDVWVVDPLDGTTSFIHGFPCYSVSIALISGGRPVVGAVYNVPLDESYLAAEGLGATRNGERVTCSGASDIREALLVTGFPYDRGAPLDRQLEVLGRVLRAGAHGIRRDGSAAVDCCHVAAGRADGFWEFGLQPWDTAAGALICIESGARVTTVHGDPWRAEPGVGIIAASPALHEALLRMVESTTD